jgi:hypothetical protein
VYATSSLCAHELRGPTRSAEIMEGALKTHVAEDCSGSEKPAAFARTLVRLLLAGLPSLLLRADLGMRHRSCLREGLWLRHYHGCCRGGPPVQRHSSSLIRGHRLPVGPLGDVSPVLPFFQSRRIRGRRSAVLASRLPA